jgi:hypothetical protein
VTAFGLLKRLRDEPEVTQTVALVEAERLARMRGEAVVPAERRFERYLRDESGDGRACDGPRFAIESCRVVEELQALGGRASRRDLRGRINGVMRGFVGDAIGDLKGLGVVRESGSGWDAQVCLEPGWERAKLMSKWSRASW